LEHHVDIFFGNVLEQLDVHRLGIEVFFQAPMLTKLEYDEQALIDGNVDFLRTVEVLPQVSSAAADHVAAGVHFEPLEDAEIDIQPNSPVARRRDGLFDLALRQLVIICALQQLDKLIEKSLDVSRSLSRVGRTSRAPGNQVGVEGLVLTL
jgi:hypothetical protein